MGLSRVGKSLPMKQSLTLTTSPVLPVILENPNSRKKEDCGSAILPFLFLGDEYDASDPSKLKEMNIRYVLNVTNDLPGEGEKDSIRYKRIPARDSFDQNLIQYFEEAFQFIDEAKKGGSNILIHCHAGISRSPTIVVAYLMYSQNMSFNRAYKFVESKRPIISPNFSFVGQLYEYGETRLKSCKSVKSPAPSPCDTNLNNQNNNSCQQVDSESPRLDTQCEALTDIPLNSLDKLRGCRSRKSSNNEFILLRPMKMAKNTKVK